MITRRTRRMASVAAIVAGTLVLGACGSSSGDPGRPVRLRRSPRQLPARSPSSTCTVCPTGKG